jgi:hypothetical protein
MLVILFYILYYKEMPDNFMIVGSIFMLYGIFQNINK